MSATVVSLPKVQDHLLFGVFTADTAKAITESFQTEYYGRNSDLVLLLSALPSKWIESVKWLFLMKPNIKAKSAIIAHLCLWRGDGKNPTEQLTYDDLQEVIMHLMDPAVAKEHNFGEGKIIADMNAAFALIRARKRRRKQEETETQERRDYEAQIARDFATPEAREQMLLEVKKLKGSLFG